MNGEDKYYKKIIQQNPNYEPYQLGYFKLDVNDFNLTITNMKIRVHNFIKIYWNIIDNDFFYEINDVSELLKIKEKKINLFNILFHKETKSLYIIINHCNVGGGDYLLLGSVLFNGKANSLFKYNNSYVEQIKNSIYKTQFIYTMFKNLYYKSPRYRLNNEKIIYSQINEINKFYVIYKILTNIINSTNNTNKLICLIPIGFENAIGNDIGVILFTFYKNSSYHFFKKNLKKLKKLANGSKLLLNSKINNLNIFYDIETQFKKKIDVVITLGNIVNNDIKIDIATSGMYYKMNKDFSYPFYIWGLSIDNKTHITYSISDKMCNVNKLCNLTNGKDITNKYVYTLNIEQIKSKI